MADQFYDSVPARANNIGTDVDQIELSLGWIKDYLQACGTWSDDSTTGVMMGNRGAFQRTQFRWKDADEIYLEPACYHHAGGTSQMVYWDTALTFQLGSGGSNAGSDDLDAGAQHVQYLYLDDSAIITAATNLISNSEILNSSTAPAWNVTNHGWYPAAAVAEVETTDRCIGAVLVDASNNVLEFFHDGGRYFELGSDVAAYSAAYPGSGGYSTSVTFANPTFCRKVMATFRVVPDGPCAFYSISYREGGGTGDGHVVGSGQFTTGYIPTKTVACREVMVNSSKQIDITSSVADAQCKVAVDLNGWYFPIGM